MGRDLRSPRACAGERKVRARLSFRSGVQHGGRPVPKEWRPAAPPWVMRASIGWIESVRLTDTSGSPRWQALHYKPHTESSSPLPSVDPSRGARNWPGLRYAVGSAPLPGEKGEARIPPWNAGLHGLRNPSGSIPEVERGFGAPAALHTNKTRTVWAWSCDLTWALSKQGRSEA